MTSPTAPATDDAELIAELRRVARSRLENPDLAIEWKAADRLEAIANRLSQEAVLREALVALADAADKCSEAPHFIVQPFLGVYRKHGETIANARAALTGKQSANLGHSISTGNRTPV